MTFAVTVRTTWAASMEAAVNSASMEPASMDPAAEARPSAGGKSPCGARMVEAVERAGMEAGPGAGRGAMKSAGAGETRMSVIEAMPEGCSVGDVASMIEEHPAAMPIGAPVAPPPAKPGEHPDPDAQAERKSRSTEIKPRIWDTNTDRLRQASHKRSTDRIPARRRPRGWPVE